MVYSILDILTASGYEKQKAHTPWDMNHDIQSINRRIFPYVGITQIRYNRSKFDYFLSACFTSSLLSFSIAPDYLFVNP